MPELLKQFGHLECYSHLFKREGSSKAATAQDKTPSMICPGRLTLRIHHVIILTEYAFPCMYEGH
jgi:hypothetical protein